MDIEKVKSIHSIYYKKGDHKCITLSFYKSVESLLILHLIDCYKKVTGEESTEEEYLNIILADDIFTNLSDLSQRVLCQLLVEYTCSIDDDGDELSFVLYFIQKINELRIIRISNEILELTNNSLGRACLELNITDEIPDKFLYSIQNITIYGDEDGLKMDTCHNYARYLTYPGVSKSILAENVSACLLKCYESNVTAVSEMLTKIDMCAFMQDLEEDEMRAAVISRLIDIALKMKNSSVALVNLKGHFKQQFKALLKFGGII